MTIIVTGDAGFIGSATIRYLIKETGHTIVNVDMLTYAGHLESLGPVVHVLNYHFERVEI